MGGREREREGGIEGGEERSSGEGEGEKWSNAHQFGKITEGPPPPPTFSPCSDGMQSLSP